MQNGNGKSGKQEFSKVAQERLQEWADTLIDRASQLKDKADEWGLNEFTSDVKSYVRKHPWQTIGIAAGMGFLAGLVLKPQPKTRSEKTPH